MAIFSGFESLERVEFDQEFELDTADREVVVILLSGQFKVQGHSFSRDNVFLGRSQGFCVSDSGVYQLSTTTKAEICIIKNEAEEVMPLSILTERSKDVGENNFSREVRTLADRSDGLKSLIVGETIKPPGNWSSWPPHKHDEYIPEKESKQKEIYLYKFENPQGFGIQVLYDKVLEDARSEIVTNNKEIKIYKGYHPVVSSPYSGMYYLWALFGENKQFNVRYESEVEL